jgi:hypothetical protein
MAENKMEQVAKMFGKKLGEIFEVQRVTEQGQPISKVYINKDGLRELSALGRYNDELLVSLISGEAKVIGNKKSIDITDTALYKKGYQDGWNDCVNMRRDGWMIDNI